jgi:tetratricopeptide (TPR) repeat protein
MSAMWIRRSFVLATLVTIMGSGCAVEEPTRETEAPAGLQEEAKERRKIQLESTRAPRMSEQASTQAAPAQVATKEQAAPSMEEELTPVKPIEIPVSRDRDPEEEKRKMSLSRDRSAKAVAQLKLGNLDRAIREARQALKIHEQNVEAMLVISEAFYKQGKYEIAQSVGGLALQIDPKVLTPDEASQAFNLRGFAYLAEDNLTAALNMFRQAAEGDEQNAAAWNNLGVQFMGKGDYATAIGCFQYAVELQPKFRRARLNLGAAQRALGQVVEARQTFDEILKLEPQSADAHFNLGVLYLDADPFPNVETTERLNLAVQSFTRYKEVVLRRAPAAKDGVDAWTAVLENAPGREFVSVEQADLYIGVAKKNLEREARRKKRNEKRKQQEAKEAQEAAEEAALVPAEEVVEEGAPATAAPQEAAPTEEAEEAEAQEPAPQGPSAQEAAPTEEAEAQEPAPQGPSAQEPAPQGPSAQEAAPTEEAEAQEPAPQGPSAQEPAPQEPAPQAPSGGGTP